MSYRALEPDSHEWITRPHADDEPARHVAELSNRAGMQHSRANIWRYEPGARGRRHRHDEQEETFIVLEGRLTMELGEPAELVEVGIGGVIHVTPGTLLRTRNDGAEELVVYAYGSPPDDGASFVEAEA